MNIRSIVHEGCDFGRRCALAGLMISGFAILGCPMPGENPPSNGGSPPSNFEDGNVDESAQSPLGKTSGEPNGDFSNPVVAVPEQSGLARLKGTVESTEDLDVYLLGALSAGDRVIVDALAVTVLDVSIAVFDGDQRLVSENDDRSNQNLDALVDFVVRHDSDRYYLVISRSAFAATNRNTGAYTAQVDIRPGGSAPSPIPQTLFLKFDGGTLDSPSLGRVDVAPFDASAISGVYAGKTEEMKQTIVDVVRQNYERFGVSVVTSDESAPDPNDKFTTIFFGGFDDSAFGISESVDLYNADLCDDAIIFTESFLPSQFSSVPSAEEMGVAIGNVAAHEVGHLLGLNHVDDDLDLMDTSSPADAFLFDQEFMESPLSAQIVPLGTQDGVLLLNETVGPVDDLSARLIAQGKRVISREPVALGGVEIVKRQSRVKSTRPRL